jgi:hypothetical protein
MDLKDSISAEPVTPTHTNNSTENTLDHNNKVDTPSSRTSMSSPSIASAGPGKTANISVRTYIYFLPYPLPTKTPIPYTTGLPSQNPLKLPTSLFEPTSTLVLTSPRNTFVDLRFLKPLSADLKAADELEWGFAGHSSSRPTAKQGVSHSTWTHFVDSRYPAGFSKIPVDEGDMYAIDEMLTLEHGHAFHPHLNAVKSHEEMWKDEAILAVPAGGTKVCAVLSLQKDAKGIRGAIVRLGQYVQGIVVMGNEVTAERWEWTSGEGEEGEWKRTKRVGRQMLPCGVLTTMKGLSVGGNVKFGEFEWAVEETWEW